jgi:hypothetical protein
MQKNAGLFHLTQQGAWTNLSVFLSKSIDNCSAVNGNSTIWNFVFRHMRFVHVVVHVYKALSLDPAYEIYKG